MAMGSGRSWWASAVAVIAVAATLTAGPAQAWARSGPVRPGLLSSITAPCVFKTVGSCQSTNPTIKTYVVLHGTLNGCTFDFSVDWGNNGQPQRVIMTNPKDGPNFLANHTYGYSNADHQFIIEVTATITAGSCSFDPGTLSFTLLSCTSSELSGPSWARRFPDSKSTSDLAPAFGKDVTAFVAAMKRASITVRTISTLRPPERAYLMHYSWLVAKRQLSPLKVPTFAGSKKHPPVGICWVHATAHGASKSASISAAGKLAAALGVASMPTAPLLSSVRTLGESIVMSTTWTRSKITIHNASGHATVIRSGPRNGSNAKLIAVGATYGVVHFRPASKARNDWSINGQ
ncbi:MAG TPA: hypothetical protein VFI65_26500 [Streptosporangiaceae bacterium]|nr:hypothetical protein [Streptosporangiaceae bacterium]